MLLHKSVVFDSRVRREAKALVAAGHEVTVLELDRGAKGSLDGFERVSVAPPQWVRRVLPFQLYRFVFLAAFVAGIVRLRPDVVHAHDAAMLLPGALGKRLTGAKLLYDSHELATGVPYRDGRWARFVAWVERVGVPRADAVITVSDGIAARLQELYGLRERPLVLRNVTDLEPPPAPTGRLRAKLGIGDAPLVLHQGAPAEDRGCEVLIDAIRLVPGAHLCFLGSGERGYEARLRRAVSGEPVHFLPSVPLDELLEHTADADVGVSLLQDTCENHRLALPNKVFEYLAAGVPVVVSDLPEVARLVTRYGVGWAVAPADPDAVASGVREALRRGGDPAFAARMKHASSGLAWSAERLQLGVALGALGAGHAPVFVTPETASASVITGAAHPAAATPDQTNQTNRPARLGALAQLGGRLGQHSAIYLATGGITVLAGLTSVAVVTRFLEPEPYGDLAVLLFFGAMVTITVNLGTLQGTFAWAFGGSGIDDEDAADMSDGKAATDRRRAYSTGIVLTAGVGVCVVALAVLLSPRLADLLIGEPDSADLVVLAAVAAACHAVWRLTVNCLRLARRPGAFFSSTLFMNLATLGASAALLAAGRGIDGVLIGQVVGMVASVALNLGLARRDVRLAVSLHDARQILRRGRALVPVVLSFQTIMLADVFLLSRTLPAADVGLYRVASRIGSVVSHLSSAFLMAWAGLRRDPLHHAADAGATGRADAALSLYYTIFVAGAILTAGVFADLLVRVAGAGFEDAAALIPFTALAFGFHGWYVVTYRTARFRTKRRWFVGLSIVAAAVFVGTTLLLVPALEAYAASAAAIIAWSVATGGLCLRSRVERASIPLASPRVALVLILAAACFGLGQAVANPSSPLGLLEGLGVLALYPVLLIALGVVPWSDLRSGSAAARSYLPLRNARAELRSAIDGLDPLDRTLLARCVARREQVDDVAADVGITTEDASRRIVAALRHVGDPGPAQPHDDRVAAYVLSDRHFADRDEQGRLLVADGVDAVDLDSIRRIARRVARAMRDADPSALSAPNASSRRP